MELTIKELEEKSNSFREKAGNLTWDDIKDLSNHISEIQRFTDNVKDLQVLKMAFSEQ